MKGLKNGEIKKAYDKLTLIVLKNRYLIPQKPQAPHLLFGIVEKQLKDHIWKEISSSQTTNKRQLLPQFYAKIREKIHNNDPLCMEIKKKHQRQSEIYKQSIQKYNQEYIKPAKLSLSMRPFNIFTQKYYKQTFNKSQDVSLIDRNAELSKKWKQMMEDSVEKANFEEYMQKVRIERVQKYQKYIQKHQIPQIEDKQIAKITKSMVNGDLRTLVDNIFQQKIQTIQMDQRQQNQKMINEIRKYQQQMLSKREQSGNENVKRQQKHILLIEKVLKYHNFLLRWNMGHGQLRYIMKICREYESINSRKNIRLQKRNKQLIENLKQYPDTLESGDFENLQQLE